MRIINCVGARPNFVKMAPLIKELQKHSDVEQILVHTGQHYDSNLSKSFFEDLDMPAPDICLGISNGSGLGKIGRIMLKFGKVLEDKKPDLVVVVGDVNSTIACALTAAKLRTKVAHVEAGLRCRNLQMQEEINRILTDRCSDYLFATTNDDVKNLLGEGIPKEKIFLVGNVLIDSLSQKIERARDSDILRRLNLLGGEYCTLTLHRAENVDNKKILSELLEAADSIQRRMKVVYPLHPRTKKMLQKFKFYSRLRRMKNLTITEPLGYLDFICLMSNSRFVLTDSGGIQEETTFLGIPCLTIRNETERPITVRQGTNTIVGTHKDKIVRETIRVMTEGKRKRKIPKLWDGKTAGRIVRILLQQNA